MSGSLFLWFDANDLLAQNRTEYVVTQGTPVDQWKNKAKSDNEEEAAKDLSLPPSSNDKNNPVIAHDGTNQLAVVDFDGTDYLENSHRWTTMRRGGTRVTLPLLSAGTQVA